MSRCVCRIKMPDMAPPVMKILHFMYKDMANHKLDNSLYQTVVVITSNSN